MSLLHHLLSALGKPTSSGGLSGGGAELALKCSRCTGHSPPEAVASPVSTTWLKIHRAHVCPVCFSVSLPPDTHRHRYVKTPVVSVNIFIYRPSLCGSEHTLLPAIKAPPSVLPQDRPSCPLISAPATEHTLRPAIQGARVRISRHPHPARPRRSPLVPVNTVAHTFHARALAGGFTPGTSLGVWLSAESLLFLSTTKPAPKA